MSKFLLIFALVIPCFAVSPDCSTTIQFTNDPTIQPNGSTIIALNGAPAPPINNNLGGSSCQAWTFLYAFSGVTSSSVEIDAASALSGPYTLWPGAVNYGSNPYQQNINAYANLTGTFNYLRFAVKYVTGTGTITIQAFGWINSANVGSILNYPARGGGGGSATWGLITGPISAQTDLQTLLATKQNNLSLTTTGPCVASTLVGAVLNIPVCTAGTGTVTSLTFSPPLTGGTITTSGVVGMPAATSSQNGYLASADWTTFNSKQAALTLPGSVTSGDIALFGGTPLTLTDSLKSFLGTGANATLTTGARTTGHALQWDASSNVVDAGFTAQPAGNYLTALTGDAVASGPGSSALTLASVNSNVGTFGDSTHCASFTVGLKGLITAASQSTSCPGGGGGFSPSPAASDNTILFGLASGYGFGTTGGSGALCIGTACSGGVDGTIDIVTAVVPRLAAANTFTGGNSFAASPFVKPVTVGSTAPPCAVTGDEGNAWLDTTSATANHFKICAEVSSTIGFQTIF
jgi:hypothetical protein